MNKNKIVRVVADRSGLTQQQTKRVIHYFFQAVVDAVREDRGVLWSGFGRFDPVYRRYCGELMRSIRFTPSRSLVGRKATLGLAQPKTAGVAGGNNDK